MKNRTVLIVDDHPLIVQGLSELLKEAGGFLITGTFSNGRQLLDSFELRQADILLLDLNIPGADGLSLLARLKEFPTRPKTIIISSYQSPTLISRCREQGADAYVLKTSDLQRIVQVIHAVEAGKKVFPDMAKLNDAPAGDPVFNEQESLIHKYKLTKREIEIIRLICENLSAKEIGERLYLSPFTVQTHRRNILKKLHLSGNTSSNMPLYQFAKQHGII